MMGRQGQGWLQNASAESARRAESYADGHLLDRYVRHADHEAFAVLVQRHGPMVKSVCSRLLSDTNDVDDAFQATFLVLIRKARTLRQPGSVGCWLYGVANRVARKVRTGASNRRFLQLDLTAIAGPECMNDVVRAELLTLVDEAIASLPNKYREPVVLCYVEGLTYNDAARRMGVPAGTVSGRLDRARDRLRLWFRNRGAGLSASVLGVLLEQVAVQASLPAAVVQSTTKAALAYSSGNVSVSVSAISGRALQLATYTSSSLIFKQFALFSGVAVVIGALIGARVAFFGLLDSNPTENPPALGKPLKQEPMARQILQRAINALGGREKVTHSNQAAWTSAWDLPTGGEGTRRTTARGFEYFRFEFDVRSTREIYIVSPEGGWRRGSEGMVNAFPKSALQVNRDHFYVLRTADLLTRHEEPGVILSPIAVADGAEDVTGVRITRADYPVVDLYFSNVTGLPVRAETQATNAIAYVFADYQDFNGLKHYTQLTTSMDDQPVTVQVIREFQVVENLDARLFEKP